MKTFTYMPLYHHFVKYAGLLFCLVGLGLVHFVSPDYQLLVYFGLLIMVFSKEKSENEVIASIRAEVFKTTFGFTTSLVLALQITDFFSEGFELNMSALMIIGLPLLFYLVLFYITLLLKINVVSDQGLGVNVMNHSRYYIIVFITILAISSLLILGIYP